MMQTFGVILVFGSLAGTAWWVGTSRPHKGFMISICLIAVFAGSFFVVQERAVEITFKGLGTIKAAAEQAVLDANEVNQIKKRAAAQSATIDLVVQQAGESKRLVEELSQTSAVAEQRLGTIEKTSERASKVLSELEQATQFTMTVIAAQTDDRKAFDQLVTWAKVKSHPFSSRAGQAWGMILDQHNPPFVRIGKVPWPDRIDDPSKLTFQQLRQGYESALVFVKPALIAYISKRQDIPKKDRMQFLADVIEHDESLKAVEYAGRYFMKEAGLKFKPLAVTPILEWWRNNKNTIQ